MRIRGSFTHSNDDEREWIDPAQSSSDSQVQERIGAGCVNTQDEYITKNYEGIFRDDALTLFNLVNAVLAGLIIFIGSFKNLLFLGVVIPNLVIGISQEIRTKRVLGKLSLITQSYLRVLRDGKEMELHMDDIVLDDILCLSTSSQVYADVMIVKGHLEVNESLVTGESDIVVKHIHDTLYSGSFVVSGQAKVQVQHVGKDDYAATIMKDAKTFRKHKPQLRDSINFVIETIGIITIPVGILLFSKQFFLIENTLPQAIVSTVTALPGMIPEDLVLLISVALAVGSIGLARHKTLVQELYRIETLARVNALCLDKTETITEGNIQVEHIQALSAGEKEILLILANMMDALQDDNATARTIRRHIPQKCGAFRILHTLPLSSARKLSAVSFESRETYIMGAYEFANSSENAELQAEIDKQASLRNRMLVLAHSREAMEQEPARNNTVIALILLSDPIRLGAPQTLDYFLSQGVDIKVISGDGLRTVHEIAHKTNLRNYERYVDADTLKDEGIPEAAKAYTVFGRVSPMQKKLMIRVLKERGYITAMIGDGVNDVMALRETDYSISVAQGGEAAKNIANLVLLDNNFASMPHIVNEGRRIIDNVQRAVSLFLVKTTSSAILSILTLFFMSRYPFEPIQLTLISSCTIGIPSFFLALGTNHAHVEGNFLINVLGHTLPGALCVVLSILYVNISSLFFQMTPAAMSTVCVLLINTSSLIVLYRVCTLFTGGCLLIFSSMTALFVACIVFLPGVFSLIQLSRIQFVLIGAGTAAIPFVIDFSFRFGNRFKLKERLLKVGRQ